MSDVPIVDIDENLRIIGTAHISRNSADVVRQHIDDWNLHKKNSCLKYLKD